MEARGRAAPSLNKLLGEIYLADNQLAESAKFLAEAVDPEANASQAEVQAALVQLVDISKRLKRAKEARIYSEQLASMGLTPEGKKL